MPFASLIGLCSIGLLLACTSTLPPAQNELPDVEEQHADHDQVEVPTDTELSEELGSCPCEPPASCCEQRCVELTSNAQHCGDCDHACNSGEACVDSACWCEPAAQAQPRPCNPLTEICCPGLGCVDPLANSKACGGCGIACNPGERCNDGRCSCSDGPACAPAQTCCNGACCVQGRLCCAGQCREANDPLCVCGMDGACAATEACCADELAGELCIDTSSSSQHCGDCQQNCPQNHICVLGACECMAGADCSVCGDAQTTGAEGCDDGGTLPGDGCSSSCQVEPGFSCDTSTPSRCLPIPAAPSIEGELSAGHNELFWRWNSPAGTAHFLARVNSAEWAEQSASELLFSATGEGLYRLEVRACNGSDGCSPSASFETRVELHGQQWRPVWRGVGKTGLTVNALGDAVPVSCHNCYNGPSDEVYTTSQALAKLRLAASRGADLLELDIADAAGTLCVNHGDLATCTGRPTLAEILADSTLANAEALLFIEIKESGADPAQFAKALLDLLDGHPDFVRNGRPVFIRSFASLERYLSAIQARLPEYPFIRHYVRFSVLYSRNANPLVASFQNELARVKQTLGFDMVEFEYRQKNLLGLSMYARHLGLGTGVYTIPGAFGEAHVAALRHEVDQITAEFRADYARSVIAENNLLAYVNVSGCQSAADTQVELRRNTTGSPLTSMVSVGVPPTATAFGTPPLMFDAVGEDRFGCSLDFRSVQGVSERALSLGASSSQNSQGFLVTAYLNFDSLSFTGTQAIVNNAEAGGFALELFGDGSSTVLRFGVHVDGTYRYHSYNVAATGLANTASLNGTDGYYVYGAYDGNGGVYLWVNQEASGSGGSFTGKVSSSTLPALIGADPQASAPTGARFHFDGIIQQVSVLDWVDHSFPAPIVN